MCQLRSEHFGHILAECAAVLNALSNKVQGEGRSGGLGVCVCGGKGAQPTNQRGQVTTFIDIYE